MGSVADHRQPVGDGAGQGVVAIAGEGQLVRVGQAVEHRRDLGPQAQHLGFPDDGSGRAPRRVVGRLEAPEEGGEGLGGVGLATDGQDADHLFSPAIDLFEGPVVEGRAGPGDGGPQRAIGQFLTPGAQRPGDGRTGARGVDNKIKGRAGATGGIGETPHVRPDDLAPRLDRHPGGESSAMEHMEQGGAVHPQRLTGPRQGRIADVEDDPSAPGLPPEQAVDGLGQGLDLGRQFHGVQHRQTRRLQHEAGAHEAAWSKRSCTTTRCPARASRVATASPAGPAPTTAMSDVRVMAPPAQLVPPDRRSGKRGAWTQMHGPG